jgi:Polysaccharide biosynthesis protein.
LHIDIFLLAAFAISGLPVVLSRKIAADAENGGHRADGYLTAGLIINVSFSAFIVALFYLFRGKLTFIFADERAVPMFLLMLPALISTGVYVTTRSRFWGLRDYTTFSFAELLEEICRIVFCVLLTASATTAASGAKSIAIGFLVSDVVCAAALILMFFLKKGRLKKPYGFKELLVPSIPLTAMHAFGGLVASLTALVIPAMLVLNGMATGEATATYGRVAGMATPLLMAPTTLTGALAVVLIPEIATAGARRDKDYMSAKIDGSILFSVFVSAFFCILYVPLGREVALIVFADELAGEYLQNSALLLFPMGLNQITLSVLNSMGLERKSFKNYVLGTSLLIVCLLTLPKYIGVYAIAVGSALCFSLTSVLNLKILSKKVVIFENAKKRHSQFVLCFPVLP